MAQGTSLSRRRQTVVRELIDQTSELFVKALKDPSLAEAMAIPATYAVLGTTKAGKTIIPEPAKDAPLNEIYIGNIPNYQWRELREEYPGVTWAILYNRWRRMYACPEGVAVANPSSNADNAMSRWMTLLVDYIADAGMIGYGDQVRRMVEASKAYDVCHSVYQREIRASAVPAVEPASR